MGESTLGNEKVKTTRASRKVNEKIVKKKMSAGNSSNSSVSGRSSSNSSDTSAETVTRQQPHVFNLSQSPQQPMYYQYYRRQTPEEDYLSTQQSSRDSNLWINSPNTTESFTVQTRLKTCSNLANSLIR